ncbi:hypothetical protein AVEN_118681-1 [Araneus ventricosus]|uniref:RNase H type-1 domain-containing protein n=1 Tax=Araneus ventricosus TaxID=182803 RepID=A0A4Y2AW69_ARAVE|nr:hypothetical protein AVEN_118681-1 [Araneus ventricosus]
MTYDENIEDIEDDEDIEEETRGKIKDIERYFETQVENKSSALRSAGSRSPTVNKVKKNYYLSEGSVGLTWVKAHAGDPGNELADHHAKLATAEGEKLEIPIPYSSVKFIIEKNLLSDWQETWATMILNQVGGPGTLCLR